MRKQNSFKLNRRSKWMLGIAFGIIIFSFITPFIFTQFSFLDFTETGAIGDTLGGIMNPFIAIGAALLTYLAFYMQFKANELQRDQFEIQLAEDKNQFQLQLSEQQEKFNKTQFENQFYEMVRLHKENVNEISITLNENYYNGNEKVRNEIRVNGREVFKYLIEEIKTIYFIAKNNYSNICSPDFIIKVSYGMFFHGLQFEDTILTSNPEEKEYIDFVNKLIRINKWHANNSYKYLSTHVEKFGGYKDSKNLKFEIAKGHSAHLAHYYRHLFQTVKFVANQDENFINYSEKRKYLRILRAQLSNQEQTMLFYNWKSEFGRNWENNINKFFTDFRMIHNINNDSLINDFRLFNIFNLLEPTYRKEENREKDPLFEFEDWS